MTDDVALGRKQTENLGRRGLAANVFVLKLCGAAAEAGYKFETCLEIGTSVNANAVTVGSSLDHCHIPGREHHRSIPQDAYVLGMGIHNEPGLHEINPIPPVEELVSEMLKYCLDPSDKDRAFVEFRPDDVVLLLINNFGGESHFSVRTATGNGDMVMRKQKGGHELYSSLDITIGALAAILLIWKHHRGDVFVLLTPTLLTRLVCRHEQP